MRSSDDAIVHAAPAGGPPWLWGLRICRHWIWRRVCVGRLDCSCKADEFGGHERSKGTAP